MSELARMKDSLLRACVVVRTSHLKSRRRLADEVKNLHRRAWRTCSVIIFSTNHITDLPSSFLKLPEPPQPGPFSAVGVKQLFHVFFELIYCLGVLKVKST